MPADAAASSPGVTDLQRRIDELSAENARLLAEQREALEQQTATAEVLQVINASPGDLVPVFEAILAKAHALCQVTHGSLQLYDGEKFRAVALHDVPEALAKRLLEGYVPGPNLRGLIDGADFHHTLDITALDDPMARVTAEGGIRTLLRVPLRKDGRLLGQIVSSRKEVRPFTEKEIALLRGFATQAVIAMENARLISETREALAQQTATTEVLQVINSSPGRLEPVFEAMLEKALRLCEADAGFFGIYDGQRYSLGALEGLSPDAARAFADAYRKALGTSAPHAGSGAGRVMGGESIVHVLDSAGDDVYRSGDPGRRVLVDVGGARTQLCAALRKDGILLGVIIIWRREVRAFSDKQVGLLQNFAAQAVIAMENARLLDEIRRRTDDLTQSLEYQTATSDVLKVISRSTFDLQPVLDTLVETAARLCAADTAHVVIRDDQAYRPAATFGYEAEFDAFVRGLSFSPGRDTTVGRVLLDGQTVHIEDAATDPEYSILESVRRGAHTQLGVPLIRESELVGVIVLVRLRVEPFSERQIELVSTFADQAVIAMENARLLNAQREALEQQQATSEVLQIINSSLGQVEPVFDALLEKATSFCEAAFGILWTYDGENYHAAAFREVPPAYAEYLRNPPPFTAEDVIGRISKGESVVHIADAAARLHQHIPLMRHAVELGGFRTILGVALRKEGTLLGAITIYRQEIRLFSDKQVSLLENFAAQAVIAMENARLLGELTRREQELGVTFDNMGDGVAMFDADQRLAAWNRNFQRIMGIDEAFLAERPAYAAYLGRLAEHGEFGTANVEAELAARLEDTDRELRLERVRPDGTVIEARRNAVPGGGFVLIYSDITARKKAEAEIAAARDTAEAALERQTATADILRVIAGSPSDVQPVFDAIAERSNRLIGGLSTAVYRLADDVLHLMSFTPVSPEADAALKALHPRPLSTSSLRATIGAGKVHRTSDTEIELRENPEGLAVARLRGFRSRVLVPLIQDGEPIGLIGVTRAEPGLIADEHVELLKTFADQAVIAIRNARLFNELREALEQQTATADILRVISQSPTDVSPVLAAVAKAALQFCDARDALVLLRDGDSWFAAAHEGPIAALVGTRPLTRHTAPGRAMLDGEVVEIRDVQSDEGDEFPEAREIGARHGFRSALAAPLMRDDVPIGALSLRRAEPGAFTPNQVELLKSFAAQAVIAIENVRLFTELREALDQQTATAEILRVISQSPTDVGPVLTAVTKAALKFCDARDAIVALRDGDNWFTAAHEGPIETPSGASHRLTRGTAPGRAILDGKVVEVDDYQSAEADEFSEGREISARYGFRSVLAAPLLRDDVAVGAISLRRSEPGAYTPNQVELLKSFAAQAVIAIENVRLFTELRDALEQQTATSEILRAISQSPTDVQPVLKAVVGAARRFCGADDAMVVLRENDEQLLATHEGSLQSLVGTRLPLDRSSVTGRATIDGRTFHVPDVASLDPAEQALTIDLARKTGVRALLAAPMLREGQAVGCVLLRRPTPGAFTPRQIELLEAFAAQAVIAIENVRLFTELRDSLERLKSAQANLIQAEKMASLGQLTAGIAHEIKNPLNFVNNFAGLSSELLDELKQAVEAMVAQPNDDRRAELHDTMALLTANLARILEHGRRADGIVKSMLAHSRGGSGDWQSSNVNGLIEEALNLAYHGARAQDQGFNVALERDFDAALTPIDVVPQDVTRVFLNLFANGFYATRKRQREHDEDGYQPALKVSTRDIGEAVEIRVRDNGIGVSADVRARLFQPFFTTKPTGEGTGLGLSISYDIVTQQHGGAIEVESEIGRFTEFTVRLPRARRVAAVSVGGER